MRLIITKPFGDYAEGQVVENVPDDVAQFLLDNAYAVESTNGEGEEAAPVEEMPKSLNAAIAKLKAELTEATEQQITKLVSNNKQKLPLYAEAKDHTHGFKSFGEYLRCMGRAAKGDWSAAQKMHAFRTKASSGQNITTDADGAYAIPETWVPGIFEKARNETFLYDYCTQVSGSGDTVHYTVLNDTSRVTGSRPLRYYKIAEGNDYTVSKMPFGRVTLTVQKYGVLAAATEEALADFSSNLETLITDQIGKEIRFALNDLIVNGAGGASDPTGILNATPLVTISKESGQGSKTLWLPNMAKMVARLAYGSERNAKFFVNRAIKSQLIQLAFDPSATDKSSAYGLTFNVADEFPLRFQGIPILELEQCAAPGNPGDIILADLTQMAAFLKPLQMSVSPHVHWINGEVMYRGNVRFDCEPLWTAAETPFKGSDTLAPFVVVESRGST